MARQARVFAAAAVAGFVACSATFGQQFPATGDGILLAPKAFRSAAAKVQPSLVKIEGFGGIAAGTDSGYQAPGEGPTTGIVLSPDGYIVSSTYNFLRKPPVITVVLPDGRRRVAQLLGRDETRKICLLKVEGVSDLPVPQLAPSDGLKVGQWVVALGVGFGAKEPAISAGIISATSRISGKAVQTDANISPANYGGPLVDIEGRLVGVCVPLSPGSQKESAGAEWYDSGIGFAVPLDGLDKILDRLKAGESLKHAFLGVQVEPYGDPPTGTEIKEVVADSPAAKAGLAAGDKITALGGTDVLDAAHLASVVHRYLAGDVVEIVIERGGEAKSVSAELAPRPAVTPDKDKPIESKPGAPPPPESRPKRPLL